MTELTPPAYPSRRALREQGLTGPIELSASQPQSRRERRILEETGAIPVIDQPGDTPDVAFQALVVSPPVAVAPPTWASSPPPIGQPTSGVEAVAGSASPPLTRRQLREQLRSPATDTTGQADQAEVEVGIAPVAPRPSTAHSTNEFKWQIPLEEPADVRVDSAEPEVVLEPVALPVDPLPPVFGSVAKDTPTASATSVSPSAPATHALILPVAPSIDVTGPLGGTGEIIVTGNIPLPRLVSETGVTGIVDLDGDDDFMEAESGPYTAPISASLAVSSRSLEIDQPMIQKPRWGSTSLVLGVSAAILGATAVGLLALALLTDVIRLPF